METTSTVSTGEVTRLLSAWRGGEAGAEEMLFPLVYDELRRLARLYFRREKEQHLLQPTALIHETFLRLIDLERIDWRDRAHFFGIAATMMRRVLVDYARSERRLKRGGDALRITLEEAGERTDPRRALIDDLNVALDALAAFDPRKQRLVELRFFAGLTVEETAEVLGCSPSTVAREWRLARAWLHRELAGRP